MSGIGKICLNRIPVMTLIDIRSAANAISAEWYQKNRHMGRGIGMPILKETGCTIDIPNNYIKFNNTEDQHEPPVMAKMLSVAIQEEDSESDELIQQEM